MSSLVDGHLIRREAHIFQGYEHIDCCDKPHMKDLIDRFGQRKTFEAISNWNCPEGDYARFLWEVVFYED